MKVWKSVTLVTLTVALIGGCGDDESSPMSPELDGGTETSTSSSTPAATDAGETTSSMGSSAPDAAPPVTMDADLPDADLLPDADVITGDAQAPDAMVPDAASMDSGMEAAAPVEVDAALDAG